jgi:hypothetical protein
VLRSLGRLAGTLFALAAIIGGIIATKVWMQKDPKRMIMAQSLEATGQLRHELGRDSHVTVTEVLGEVDDDAVDVKVAFPLSTPQAERRELENSATIIIRRSVHHVRDVKIIFGDDHSDAPAPLPPGPDGGTSVPIAAWALPSTEPIVANPTPAPLTPTTAAASSAAAASPTVAAPKKAAAKKTSTGTITLVTFPESDVFKGKEHLGKTPLFNIELPVGTHMLNLVGSDGSRHSLSLPVRSGKNAPVKVNLDDVPSR